MKKLLALILAGLMIFTFAACGKDAGDKDANKLEGVEAPVDILSAIWDTYDAETEKFFAMGGDFENPVDNAPGTYNISNKENVAAQLVCPEDALAMVDGAASLMHAMNANTFTGAAYSIKEGASADAFITAMKTAIQGNQWMCGFPEKLLTAKVTDDYVVVAFGNGEIIETFKGKLTAQYDFAVVEVDAIA
jgi:hypothetical protein